MNSSEIEQLTDELIGEAVLSLLKENGPISTQALIRRLKVMESKELDVRRREMLVRVIAEISSNNLASLPRGIPGEKPEWDKDTSNNVYPLFGESKQSGGSKKH